MATSFKSRSTQPFLLASDIDGTLLQDDKVEKDFKDLVRTHRERMRLAYVTARRYDSVKELVDQGSLPVPDFICSSMGTEIHDSINGNSLGKVFQQFVSAQWDRDQLRTLGVGTGVGIQEEQGQAQYKVSFYWDGQIESLKAFQNRLSSLENVKIIPSHNQYLDVIPACLGKGVAVEFLRRQLDMPTDNTVVAGDSENDLELFQIGACGILPKNAHPRLTQSVSGPLIYQSLYPSSRGVLDGLSHFGFLIISD